MLLFFQCDRRDFYVGGVGELEGYQVAWLFDFEGVVVESAGLVLHAGWPLHAAGEEADLFAVGGGLVPGADQNGVEVFGF